MKYFKERQTTLKNFMAIQTIIDYIGYSNHLKGPQSQRCSIYVLHNVTHTE